MNLNLTSQVEMTGFIVDEGCLYAVLKVAEATHSCMTNKR